MIKKAKRIPEEVEYFVWDGTNENIPNWKGLHRHKETPGVVTIEPECRQVWKGQTVVRYQDGTLEAFYPNTFAALFVPMPEEKWYQHSPI